MPKTTTRQRYTEALGQITDAAHRLGLAADELAADDRAHALVPYLRKQSAAMMELAKGLRPPEHHLTNVVPDPQPNTSTAPDAQ